MTVKAIAAKGYYRWEILASTSPTKFKLAIEYSMIDFGGSVWLGAGQEDEIISRGARFFSSEELDEIITVLMYVKTLKDRDNAIKEGE